MFRAVESIGMRPAKLWSQEFQQFNFGDHAWCFGLIDLADGDEMLRSAIAENDAPRAAAELERSQELPLLDGNVNPVSRRSCCQNLASRSFL
jgi:hypothetical protein